jgi:hypothetical protein
MSEDDHLKDARSKQRRLAELRENLRLIEEQKAKYVLEVDVPPQLIKEERHLRERIAQLEADLAAPFRHATPPAPPAHFTGREEDLANLMRLLTSGENVAITALHGMGGIGKTSLALKLAEQLNQDDPAQRSERSEGVEGRPYFPGGVLWWSLGPHPDVFTALDVWARHADPRADLSALPTAEARAEIVRSMLARLDKLCVMIDDV